MGLFPRNINEYLAIQGIPRGPNSQVYIVDPANGSDSNPGTSVKAPLASIEAAYALCTTNQHDVVLYTAGSSGNNLAAAVTWSKSYTHLVGWCAPTQIGQRSRIFQTSTLTGASPLLTVSGSGCIFKNFYIFQGVNDNTSLINVSVTGGRNYFENVHFAGGGHATQAIDGGASLKLDGGSENTFVNCTVGVDTVAAATGMVNLLIDGGAARNRFKGCLFLLYAAHAGAMHVEVADNAGFDRFVMFEDCMFINDCRTYTLTTAFSIPASMTSVTNFMFLKNCSLIGSTDWDASDRGVMYLSNGTITGGGNSGYFVVSAAT